VAHVPRVGASFLPKQDALPVKRARAKALQIFPTHNVRFALPENILSMFIRNAMIASLVNFKPQMQQLMPHVNSALRGFNILGLMLNAKLARLVNFKRKVRSRMSNANFVPLDVSLCSKMKTVKIVRQENFKRRVRM
jgi:hypothetical protein